MAALNFPASPVGGQIYSANGLSYQWDAVGLTWKSVTDAVALVSANNLSDLADAATARGNLLPSRAGNANKVLAVKADETDYELIASGGAVTNSTTEILTGTDTTKVATADSIAALWEKGSDVASAGTISLGEGGYFNITGTTTITDIDFATDKAGRAAWVKFAGALTLTRNASTLILPGGANITTAAGDTACFISEGSDVVRCVSYNRASGVAVTGGSGSNYVINRLYSAFSPGISINVNSTTYIFIGSGFTNHIDLDEFPATHFRIIMRGQANAAGQTITMQLSDGLGTTPVHTGGDDLVLTNTLQPYDSGWRSRDDAATGTKRYGISVKGSNATVDLVTEYLELHWAINP